MHQPIQEYLEEYLRDPNDRKISQEFHVHLAACGTCAATVQILSAHTRVLHTLRTSSDVEPAPGFYARVMNQVEARTPDSFWSVFLEPAFGKKLAFASGFLVLLLGTYLVSTEPVDNSSNPPGIVMSTNRPLEGEDGTVAPKQRDEILVNLVTFQE